MLEDIKKIIKISAHTPSGDNSQPWAFKINNNVIDIYNSSSADSSMYNFKQRGSLIAHGALIENIRLTAKQFGCQTKIIYLPDMKKNLFSRIVFEKSENIKIDEDFSKIILQRNTNRRPYKKISIPDKYIVSANKKLADLNLPIDLKFFTQQDSFKQFGKVLSLNEKLIFENEYIHKDLFSTIRWRQEDEVNNGGMYIKALELTSPQIMIFKLLSNWSRVKIMNKIKISDFIAFNTASLYSKTGAFGLLTCADKDPVSFLYVGRAMQRLWLYFNKHNFGFQPVTALLYLKQRVLEADVSNISEYHHELILKANSYFESKFEVKNQVPALLFRVGFAKPSTYRSVKKNPFYL